MRVFAWLGPVLLLLFAALPASAASPLVLEPSSKWIANYADDSCRLVRTFGEGPQQIRLEFRLFDPGESFWVILSGKPLGAAVGGRIAVAYRFDPDERDSTRSFAMGASMDDHTGAVIFAGSLLTVDQQENIKSLEDKREFEAAARWNANWVPEREAQITAFEIAISGKPRLILKLGDMKPPMDVMRNCLDDLLTSWGLDVKVQKSLERTPVPTSKPAHWLNSSDYPKQALTAGLNDQVDFRLTIDATGTPTDCAVLTMESRPEFIKATCDGLMKRAHFKPALDAAGQPVASIYISTVIWAIR